MNFEQQRNFRRLGAFGLLVVILTLPTVIAFAPLVAAIGHISESAVNALRDADVARLSLTVLVVCVVVILAIMIRQGIPPAPHDHPRDDS